MKKLNEKEITSQLANLDDWATQDGFLVKSITFQDFKEAFTFMTRIAFEAEKMDHHPNWSNVYNQVEIKLQTHSVGGISIKDIELAKRIDDLI